MAVRVGDELSTCEPILSGVYRGSVLVPRAVFFLFINDVPAPNITTLFADYSKLIGNARSPATIQSDLHFLSQWADVWQMKFNPKNNYMMGHTPLQVVEKERDLGVVVSAGDTLCWGGTNTSNDWKSKTKDVLDH